MLEEKQILLKNKNVSIRTFVKEDIENKVKWINDPRNNLFLHYDLPLEIKKTLLWFNRISKDNSRFDAIIEYNNKPVGLIGLLSIDSNKKEAEYYITIGEQNAKGKGIAAIASRLLLNHAFFGLNLEKIYLLTEVENFAAQKLFSKLRFNKYKEVKEEYWNGKILKRYYYELTRDEYLYNQINTPVTFLDQIESNNIYIKRDDLLPYSFGGNKVRKAINFFKEIKQGNYNAVVTYGSEQSNHCRIIANMSKQNDFPCYIVSPTKDSNENFNYDFMQLFDAHFISTEIENVKLTINKTIEKLIEDGLKPYFIPGGGHGNPGTKSYVSCYEEIKEFENDNSLEFDYIFFASGTGTTHAGLISGKLLQKDSKEIIGISIARKNPYGSNVVFESVQEYLPNMSKTEITNSLHFVDSYISGGYGQTNKEIDNFIKYAFKKYGVPFDSTYTAKAFVGMKDYLKENNIRNKKILFIHTGGTPLFFDDMRRLSE